VTGAADCTPPGWSSMEPPPCSPDGIVPRYACLAREERLQLMKLAVGADEKTHMAEAVAGEILDA